MKRLFILLLLFPSLLFAQDGVKFMDTNWYTASQKAKASGKMLMVFICTDWADPCPYMEEVWDYPEVGNYYNEQFVNLQVDGDKLPNFLFAKQFKVTSLPEIMFFTPEFELAYSTTGYLGPEEVLALAQEAQNPKKQYSELDRRFAAGEKDAGFLLTYFQSLYKRNRLNEAEKLGTEILNNMPKSKWPEADGWQLIQYAVTDARSPEYRYILDQGAAFIEKVGEEQFRSFLLNVYGSTFQSVVAAGDAEGLKAIQWVSDRILDPRDAKANRLQEWSIFYQHQQNWEKWYAAHAEFLDFAKPGDWESWNDGAWNVYLHFKDPEYLKKALLWAEEAVARKKNYQTCDTRAHLLYVNGMPDEATTSAQSAIRLGNHDGLDVSGTQALLEKIKGQ